MHAAALEKLRFSRCRRLANGLRGPYDADVDAECARAIAAFRGDINACDECHCPLLCIVAECKAPLTLAAFAARGDVAASVRDVMGNTPIFWALRAAGTLEAFLAAFPLVDLGAPCNGSNETPLAAAICWYNLGLTAPTTSEVLQILLRAGAELEDEGSAMWGMYGCPAYVFAEPQWFPHAALLAPHVAWVRSRRGWLTACVAIAVGAAEPVAAAHSSVPACVLADAVQRLCIPPSADALLYGAVSEYAGLVAMFLN